MRTGFVAVAVVSALGVTFAPAGATDPPAVGSILLLEKTPGACTAKASSVDVDLDTQGDAIMWVIKNTCTTKQHIKVGMTKDASGYKEVLKCNPHVQVKKDETKTLTCHVLCGAAPGTQEKYDYSVCNKKDAINDPELRVKGGGRPGCKEDDQAKAKCIS